MAEVADEGASVGIRVPAAAAVLGVMGVLELRHGDRWILDPEVGHSRARLELGVAPEVGDQRIVGVEYEPTASSALAHQRGPMVCQRFELSVAVELVAEEV